MNLILLARYWKYIVIGVLAMLLVFTAYLLRQSHNTIAMMKSDHELQLTTLKANYVETARDIERQAYEQTIQAVNEAKKREQVIIADAASARNAVSGLSATIDTLAGNAAADANFRIEYSRTTGNLLKECSSQYIEMAEITDRLDNSLRAIEQANKRK